jgi:peptidoglycan/LPS O-acetylase OafA/YrhL
VTKPGHPAPVTRPSSGRNLPPDLGHGDVVSGEATIARPTQRADIDGLRAVAVLPVLLFHAHVPYFTGGYVGVDVFFVISGYLITAILFREMAADRFSIFTFYERRVRRIIPALVTTMALVLAVSWLLFLPKDLADTGQSLIATSTFVSNFLFYFKTTYFGTAAENLPLLHTWSLAVEEQFYIFFPMFLFLVMRFARAYVVPVLAVTAALSLLSSGWSIYAYPVETFYFPLTRAWELLLGSVLAVSLQKDLVRESSSGTLAAIGLALVLGSILLLDRHSRFPGLTAFPVCFGTTLLLYAGSRARSGLVGRFLENRFFVFTGLISYSLYLWHWPALAFATYYLLRPPSGLELVVLLGAVYLLSILSWRFVETPIRKGQMLRSRSALFAAGFIALVGFSVAGAALVVSGGAPGRLPSDVVRLSSARFLEHHLGCPPAPGAAYGAMCRIGQGPVRFVVWGDSHADAIRPAFQHAATNAGSSGFVLTANGCPPAVGLVRERLVRQQNDCEAYNREAVQLIRRSNAQAVFLTANWLEYEPRGQFKNGTLADGLEATLRSLRGVRVYLVSRVPGGRIDVASGLARAKLFHRPVAIGYTRAEVDRIQGPLNRLFERLQRDYGVQVIWTGTYLCGQLRCPVEVNGVPLYSDAHHLTPAGDAFLVRPLQKVLAPGL